MQTLEDKILANPDDWDGWLVYGDWLIEQGDPRGTLIGLEHRVRTQPMPAEERKPLVAQLQREQKDHEERFLSGKGKVSGLRLQWRAGFLLGAELWTWWGDTKELAFLEAIPADPVGRLFRRLRVKSHCGLAALQQLAASPVLASVRALVLSDIGMDAGTHNGVPGRHGLDLVAASTHLQVLASLDVSGNDFSTDARPTSTSTSPNAPTFGVAFADDKGEVLARLALSELNLRKCALGDSAVASLVGREGHLTRLDLTANRLTAEGVKTLAASTALIGLRALVLRDNPIGAEGFDALASSTVLGALEHLDLSFTLSDRGPAPPGTADRVAPMLAAASLPHLRELNLRGTGLSDAGLAVLTASEALRNCQILR